MKKRKKAENGKKFFAHRKKFSAVFSLYRMKWASRLLFDVGVRRSEFYASLQTPARLRIQKTQREKIFKTNFWTCAKSKPSDGFVELCSENSPITKGWRCNWKCNGENAWGEWMRMGEICIQKMREEIKRVEKVRKICTGKLWQNFCIISENSWEIFEIFIIIDLFSIKVQKLWKC